VDGETAEVEAELCPGARVMVAFWRGVSMRSPGGGSILRGAGRAVEEGSMVHALRGLMLWREDEDSLLFSRSVNCEGVKIDTGLGKVG
jgi:hypothetical protein